MNLPFLNRVDELRRLSRATGGRAPALVVLYGRRRCGKSTLIQKVVRARDVYFLADEQAKPLQIQAFAQALDGPLPGFAAAEYPSWASLITSLSSRLDRDLTLFIDEFPYLVRQAPELPSLIQHDLDRPGTKRIRWVLCGSSQRMMQGLLLERTAPLYGRAQEVIHVRPLEAGWIARALRLTPDAAIEAYSVWGGVPRYWELARTFGSTRDAVQELVLDRNGVLHSEPLRLLLDDMRTAVQAYSLLTLIGAGSHRLSEISSRLGKPAGSLTRPLANLIELGLVHRDTPWGEDLRSTKRSLYRLRDPFLQFHTRFVQPVQALLELGRLQPALQRLDVGFPHHVSGIWEQVCRESVPGSGVAGIEWGSASRWWGAGLDGRPLELDLVAESVDGRLLLIGEAKWNAIASDAAALAGDLAERAARFPAAGRRRIVQALWLKQGRAQKQFPHVLSPRDVLTALQ